MITELKAQHVSGGKDDKVPAPDLLEIKEPAPDLCNIRRVMWNEVRMRNQEKDAIEMAAKRQRILEAGFRLFSERTIERVAMNDVSKACGIGIATLYRYYRTKPALVVAVGTWVWEEYIRAFERERQEKRMKSRPLLEERTAREALEEVLSGFVVLYRDHKDILRFNQFFNIYIQSEAVSEEVLEPYQNMIRNLAERFHRIYCKGMQDGSLRTEVSETTMFTFTIHMMLAVATRYAVGLVYLPDGGANPEEELLMLKNMLLREFGREI